MVFRVECRANGLFLQPVLIGVEIQLLLPVDILPSRAKHFIGPKPHVEHDDEHALKGCSATCNSNSSAVIDNAFPAFLRSRCSAELFGRYEILVSALDRKHIADHFPGNGKRSAVRITSFQFSGVDDSQLG